MAVLIPPKPLTSATPAVMRMFRLLKKLSDDFTVRHLLAEAEGPQFLVLWRERHAFLVKVAETSQELADKYAESILSPSLLPTESAVPAALLDDGSGFQRIVAKKLPPDLPVRCLLVFPNINGTTIDEIERLHADNKEVRFLGLRQTPVEQLSRYFEEMAREPVSDPMLMQLRESFDTGSQIHAAPTRVPLLHREARIEIPRAYLDLGQEMLAKLEVDLPPEAERLARKFETRLITGPAGCGKSLVLLHRALFAARLNRRSRLLVLTHNKPINSELQRRARATAPEGSRMLWLNFFQWAVRQLPDRPRDILSHRKVANRVAALCEGRVELGNLAPAFIAEEFGYLRDLGVGSLEEYLALDRAGRLMALTSVRREAIWSLLETYRGNLANGGESDWHELALRFRDLAREHPGRLPKYDFIFVDEAQFFAKVWFAPVVASLAQGAQLFLAADPTQGFLKRRESWLAAGIDVRGRSTRLAKPYRSTRAILSFARKFLEERRNLQPGLPYDDLDPPSDTDIAATEDAGESPLAIPVASPQEAITRAVREVAELRKHSPQLAGNVLLLHADSFAAPGLVQALRHRLGEGAVADLNDRDQSPGQPFCSVSNLLSATGLEAAVVFLLGVDDLLDREADPRLDESARAELVSDHTRLLYMAFTRAGSRLVIFSRRWEEE